MLPEAEWYAALPSQTACAVALITNSAGETLLVKPNYRDHWIAPGGTVEASESPLEACRREVAEELGVDLTIGALLAVDWIAAELYSDWDRPLACYVFDGGQVDAEAIRLQAEELDACAFVPAERVAERMRPRQAARMAAAHAAKLLGRAAYLENGYPAMT